MKAVLDAAQTSLGGLIAVGHGQLELAALCQLLKGAASSSWSMPAVSFQVDGSRKVGLGDAERMLHSSLLTAVGSTSRKHHGFHCQRVEPPQDPRSVGSSIGSARA